ncbi:aminopeptidase P N-terminal domain-containing protein [Xanthomonas campestris pv. campestris]|uniref:aminopeptidase P N-terminal domain-containing protein n=1 Tax=Xanthomonas campestris TaxID=339 RepID=UPI001EEDF79C|nr:aminopeptidase P N-terminal domain-containing protein [Xanthomonas campestris]MCF8838194.1 aminopeptidase P N-terminal domain-containing protein [Xanthomonas campestris pv. campestris]MDO0882344.1 aminopeptidase P N-terminal domain-containing protein [Xanthomonas campestris pv. campestris]MEA0634869.1 aminopeptidase P N-terminal domain-containing protein [Xanthomonas campestris pv. campestris]MEA0651140.1 aminopeptidase P N-terminal domain-containing protein [Xanthomonas campestris pv. campe
MKKLTGIGAAEYARRRKQLMQMAGEQAILILPAAPERVRSHDTHYPYRQDSDFWYLSGFPEPEAVLVLVPGRKHGETILFCRERDAEREAWDGPRAGQQGAVAQYGMDDAYPIDDVDEILPGLLEGRSRVYYHFGRDVDFDLKLIGWLKRVREQVRHGAQPPHEFLELGHLLHEQRLFKSRDEIALMQQAADISVRAHRAAMQLARPGVHEYQLQAEIEREFRAADAWPAYGSIVGTGSNACVLHYRANNARSRDGELVLVDAGAEYRGYAADITRTFPVNGRFSAAQRALHDLVGAAQAAALAQAQPGIAYEAGHLAAVQTLTEGLLRLGLLKGTLERNLAEGHYKRFYRHKTGHWLGLDVHDVGEYRLAGESRLLEPGMVFTIEPGLYVSADDTSVDAKWRGIGIRTEDNVLITADGHRVLTDALARSADEIQGAMAGGNRE